MYRASSFLAVVLLAAFTPTLDAQSTNASISGSVSDPTEARVVGARVVAVNPSTNARFETRTNGSGDYQLTSLTPGLYRLEVEKADFKKLIKPDVVVHVQDDLEINFKMALGPASDSVTVEGGAPLLDTSDGTVSTVVNRHFIDHLPLNGRSFQTLIILAPGVVVTPATFNNQGQFSVNGQRADANYFTVDGVSANFGVTGNFPLVQSAGGALPALSVSGGTNSVVSLEAMQEFRIQTSSVSPEFGRTPGGQVAVVTRSGTNDLHGTLFDYFRNGALDARDWFVNFNDLPKPDERQNDFGGVFGGPIIKDKTFFFFSYEGLRLHQPVTAQSVVPSATSRQQASAGVQPFLNAFPIPNGPAAGAGVAQFNAAYSNPSSLDAYSIRVDHVMNSKFNLFGRYNYSPSSLEQRGAPFTTPALSAVETLDSSMHTFTVGLTGLITPSISNEMRLNYSNQRLTTKFKMDNFGGAAPIPDSVLFPSGFSSPTSSFLFLISGVGEFGEGKGGTDEQRQVNVVDNLSLATGRHNLKFGVDYRWLAPFSSPFAYRQFVQFSGVTANPGGALSGTAAFVQPAAFESDALFSQNLSLYGQDAWRVTPRLSLTYGLRWDINPALTGKNSANDPFTVIGLNNPSTMMLAPRGTSLYDTTYGNVAPRIGVAYQLRQSTGRDLVIRCGFGIFYDIGQGSLGGTSANFPYTASKSLSLVPFPLSSQNSTPPPLTSNPPVATIFVAEPHLELPRTYQWNAALEQSIDRHDMFSLTYVGSIGRDLLRINNLFNPSPNFQTVQVTSNSATSDYHALQARFERRLSQGLQALTSYTWAHSIDIASNDVATNLNTPISIANPNIDRGNSDFDIRNSFTAGVTYNIPSPEVSRVINVALAGWSVDSFVYARSAPPVDIVGAISFATGTALMYRPNVVPGTPLELFGSQYPGGKIFNKAAFAAPTGQQGDLERNVLRAFDAAQLDFVLQRDFRLTERGRLHFRSEFFNIFNHPNFGPPTNLLTSPLFGHSTQTLASSLGSGGANGGFNPLYQIGGPRSIQLALKLQF